jgi:hypothetical protein
MKLTNFRPHNVDGAAFYEADKVAGPGKAKTSDKQPGDK